MLEQQLAPFRSRGRIHTLLRTKPVAAETNGDRITGVRVRNLDTGHDLTISAPYVIDATELGELLPLAGVEYVAGAESQAETGELHARPGPARPDEVQAFTWCFPMAYDTTAGADHTIERFRSGAIGAEGTARTRGIEVGQWRSLSGRLEEAPTQL